MTAQGLKQSRTL